MIFKIAVVIVLLVLAYIGYEYVRIERLIRVSATIVAHTQPFERSDGTMSILVLGDSTAVGVGASTSTDSTAGRLSEFLDASIENYAQTGAVVADLPAEIAQAKRSHYDLILVQIGANDVVDLHPLQSVNAQMNTILQELSARSEHVVLLTAGDIGDAPLFPLPARPLFNYRAATLRSLFMRTAQENGALYVDLAGTSDVFQTDPQRYYAADSFHPSSDGYALWFNAMKTAIVDTWPNLAHE